MSPEQPTLQTEEMPSGRFSRAIRTAGIVGLGTALPERRVSSAEVAERLGVSAEWIERRTGVRERRYAAPGQRVSDLAVSAGRIAWKDAGLHADVIDMVLVATVTQDEMMPDAAPIVAHELGAVHAGAIDVGAACTARSPAWHTRPHGSRPAARGTCS